MTRPTFDHVCQCCGVAFTSGYPATKWCHVNCRVQAYQCRKRGEPVRPAFSTTRTTSPDASASSPVRWHARSTPGHDARLWRGVTIAKRESDGYTNATAMCQANGRRWNHYQGNNRTAEYIQALAASTGIDPSQLVTTTATGHNDLRGTWVHPSLAVDLARWISPAFAVWMDEWFLQSAKPVTKAEAVKLQPLPSRQLPLIGERPTVSELASQLHQEASQTLESIQFELELLSDSAPPLVEAIAKEFHATAHRLHALGVALHALA